MSIDLTHLDAASSPLGEMLTRYLGMIQVQRQDFNGRVLTIRHDDANAIACAIGTNVVGLCRMLDDLGLR